MARKYSKINTEMIPLKMWGKNLRNVISKSNWDNLRYLYKSTKSKPDFYKFTHRHHYDGVYQCAICKIKEDEFELHEVWKFNDRKRIQKLVDLIPLCNSCHMAIHIGRASQLGKDKDAIAHIQKVNKWSKAKTLQHIKDAQKKWIKRSLHVYELDLSWFQDEFYDVPIRLERLEQENIRFYDKLSSIEWADDVLKRDDYVILDTETTGLYERPEAEVIELAIISMKGKVLYNSRFKPKSRITKDTTVIHGITNNDVKNCHTFGEASGEIKYILNDKIVIAYNSKFDSRLLERTFNFYNRKPIDVEWCCAMWAYKYFMNSPVWLKLPNSKHSALADCRATLRLLKKISKG